MVRGMENRVGFGLRLGAYVLDFIILSVLALALRGPLVALFPEAFQQMLARQMSSPGMDEAKVAAARSFMEAMTRWSFSLTILAVVYGLIEGLTGWSPGKLILGIRVVDQSGQPASVGNLLVRYLFKNSASLVVLVGVLAASGVIQGVGQAAALIVVIGCFLVLGKARQALHDRIAGTVVLRKSDVGVTAAAAPSGAVSP
jgi:uncharacterized RDD family membrane protein YckC